MIKGKKVLVENTFYSLDGKSSVTVQVEAIIPDNDPSEFCFTPDTIKFIDDIIYKLDHGFVDQLKQGCQ